jgi:predicted CopG family antitoxin
MTKAAKKNKPPSRVRYEQAHPTVSCRVSRDVYQRLSSVMEEDSRSFADVLKVGLGILEVQAKGEREVRKKGYTEGYKKGYAEAEGQYKVTYPCSVCGGTLTVSSEEEKKDIKKYMREHGWGHKACHERKQ